MKNKEIKNHKQKFTTIKNEVNIAEKGQRKELLTKLVEGIRKAQRLADDVGATKYLGTDVQVISESIDTMEEETHISLLRERIEVCERIFNELCYNIYYALQTEEMFNACVLAKRACFWAFAAVVVACISVLLNNLSWFVC